jgi:hypothetical protein
VGTPFAGDVTYMEASSKDVGIAGATRFSGGCNPLFPFIALAPYCFPLLTAPFLLAEPFAAHLSATAKHVVDLLIGSTLGFHYVICAKQFRFYQKDLEQVGFIVSIGMTFTLMLIWLVIILAVVLGEYSSILDFFVNAFAHAPEYYREVFAWLQSL